jgi:glucosyl-3-phosphoglycerate synthase
VSDDVRMPEASEAPPTRRAARRFDHTDFTVGQLAALKGDRTVSVCIPARDEAPTVGAVVRTVNELTARPSGPGLVDEIVVIDDGSSDGTAAVAGANGATVIANRGGGGGKGQAMRTALEATKGDLIVYVDADVTNFGAHFVTGLLGPLLADDGVRLVKAHYRRPLEGAPDGGGRVTELVARPLIDLLFPQLSSVVQPLAGETAAPRDVLERCDFADGYAVELALLVDVAALYGAGSVAQVDLGTRVHRNRPLAELRPQATDILRVALERSGLITPD